ncbi:carbon-nitrogen hydrolase family protein [Mesorhizobium shangrilense]|uniref:Carbon-nitrogen hydrolase family protein n=1 Tax=Mesorhizobium shangrilense TaxID=460060 RepID=A0ABV2DNK4_9HYPH
MTTCAFVEWPEGLEPRGLLWEALRQQVAAARPDILVTNEMPFGPWLASERPFDADAAARGVTLHEHGLEALRGLGVPAVISSRPVWQSERLANEAFVLEAGDISVLHRKQLFPEEPGWYEASWFRGDNSGFAVHDIAGLKVGVLLCTELMFNEHARGYGRAGGDLIVVPRATSTSQEKWAVAGAMGAIVSGCYVVSSNRSGASANSPRFGGRGLAFAPDGTLLADTSSDGTLAVVDLDAGVSQRQKSEYPCNVVERAYR